MAACCCWTRYAILTAKLCHYTLLKLTGSRHARMALARARSLGDDGHPLQQRCVEGQTHHVLLRVAEPPANTPRNLGQRKEVIARR
jgi:hypothetical protein